MSEELEHIDTIFSDKLKDYREKPSAMAWDKLASALDQKDKGNHSSGKKGNLGLLSITVISFMFLFSGHEITIPQKPITEKVVPLKEKENISKSLPKQAATITEEVIENEEEPNLNNVVQKLKITNLPNTISTETTEMVINESTLEDKVSETVFFNDLSIDKKPPIKLRAPQKTNKNRKGIKVEITLDTTETGEGKRETAPQTKNTLNTIFKKLRKFTEASKKN